MKKHFLRQHKWIWVLVGLPLITLGAFNIERNFIITTFNDFSGGVNWFSSQTHVRDNQALDLENWLFQGTHLRARRGLTSFNTTSLGGYAANQVFLYEKPSGFSQILACYNGKVYYADPDSSDFSDYITDRSFTVSVTNGDSLVTGTGTFFNLLGYNDSIEIFINDTTHFIHEIIDSVNLTLYDQWAGGTGAAATLKQPFYVDANDPVDIKHWLDHAFISGTEKLGEWDGDTLEGDLGDTTSFKITNIILSDGCDLTLTCTPSFATSGYDYNDLKGYYIYGYNDTTTDTAQAAGNHPIFNKPLKITMQGSNYVRVWADSFWVADQADEEWRHLDTNDLVKLMAPPTSEKLVFAGVWDSLHAVGSGWVDSCSGDYPCYQWINAYDSSQTWDKHALNFGIYELRRVDTSTPIYSNIFLRADGNGVVYLYAFYRDCVDWAQGDSFEIYRLYSSQIADIPSLMAVYQDRAWFAGYLEEGSYVKYSELFDPDSFKTDYFIYVAKDDGDIVTVLFALAYQNALLAGKEKHIYAISGQGPYNWYVDVLSDNIGMPAPASIVSRGSDIYWYDYSGFYTLEGSTVKKVSWAIEAVVRDSINKDYAHMIVGGYFDEHFWWSYPSGSATKNNRTVVYSPDNEAWAKIDRPASSLHVGLNEHDEYGVLWGDPDSGKVYAYGDSYFDDGSGITCTFESGWLNLPDEGMELVKQFKSFALIFDKHDSSVVYITYYKDYSDTAFSADTIGIDNSDIMRYYKRQIRGGDDIVTGTRLKVKIQITRADYLAEIPLFQIKWRPVGEPLYDE